MSPPAAPEAYPLPGFVAALMSAWPTFLLIPWLLLLWAHLKDWRLYALDWFRDEGCDETREARFWKKEKMLMVLGSLVSLNITFALLIYVGLR